MRIIVQIDCESIDTCEDHKTSQEEDDGQGNLLSRVDLKFPDMRQ
jgi:hypothetical protein